MIYLDTHVVVWLYAGLVDKLSTTAHQLINDNDVFISPVVRLELQYLLEVQRITVAPDTLVADLANRIGLQVCAKPFNRIVSEALANTLSLVSLIPLPRTSAATSSPSSP